MSEYLNDPSSPPEEEIEALEKLLKPHAFREELDWERVAAAQGQFAQKRNRRRMVAGVGLALVAAAALAFFLTRSSGDVDGVDGVDGPLPIDGAVACATSSESLPWSVAVTSGRPQCGGENAPTADRLVPGGWISTDNQSSATVAVADIGEINVRPGTRIALTRSGPDRHQLELTRGSIHAKVTAPPRLFMVTTPTVNAVDLGCEYDLEYIEESETTQITVTNGAVSLETTNRVVEVPAGFRARSFKDLGPTPAVSIEAPDELLFRVAAYLVERKRVDLNAALSYTTERDSRTLVGLLDLVGGGDCEPVHGKLLEVSTQAFPWEQTSHGCHDLEALRSAWRGLYNFDEVPLKNSREE